LLYSYQREAIISDSASPKPGKRRRATLIIFVLWSAGKRRDYGYIIDCNSTTLLLPRSPFKMKVYANQIYSCWHFTNPLPIFGEVLYAQPLMEEYSIEEIQAFLTIICN